jgi:Na+-transporting NADH:ubiquinone oxidoreductase subunit A
MIRIKQGLDLPISGAPDQTVRATHAARRVAVLGSDFVGMKPALEVAVGETVSCGGRLLTDRKNSGVLFTAPAAGTVVEINRGARRVFESLVIERTDSGDELFEEFATAGDVDAMPAQGLRSLLIDSGLWTAFRQRPYSIVPPVASEPASLFVTAIDTNPLAADPAVVLATCEGDFVLGLRAVCRLADVPVHLITAPESDVPGTDVPGVIHETFSGPHPAGLPGTHIHFLSPASERRVAWHIGYQDVAAIGSLLRTGRVDCDRVVSLCGPAANEPRLLRTRLGTSLPELVAGESHGDAVRVISGSVLAGRTATGAEAYLGRYHTQVSLLPELVEREWLGWQRPGRDKFSVTCAFVGSALFALDRLLGRAKPRGGYTFNTSQNGSDRAMVPIGSYERVMPLDVIPTYLLRALVVEDTEQARELGALELDEEDLSLCTYVCPGKYDYGSLLRRNLDRIRLEG